MNVKRKLLHAVALLAMFSAFEANAQTQTDLTVTAEVPEACDITNGPLTIDFGTVDPTATGPDYTIPATLEYECSVGTAGWVELNGGLNGGDGTWRYMNDGANLLQYRLQQTDTSDFYTGDPGAGGDGVAFAGVGFGNTLQTVIEGVLTNAQIRNAQAGTYSDTVLVTLVLN